MNISRPMNMLIVDDHIEYVHSIKRNANRHRILLSHAGSLEEAKDIMEQPGGKNILGVILDVVCKNTKNQSLPRENFISLALSYFTNSFKELPIVVLTGEPSHFESLTGYYDGSLKVYSKGRDEEALLEYLKSEAIKNERYKIINRYSDIFKIIELRFDSIAEDNLIHCIKAFTSGDNENTEIANSLTTIRRLEEKCFIALNKVSKEIVPTHLIENGVDIPRIYTHLSSKGYTERYKIIDRFAELIHRISSENGAHVSASRPKYLPTKYTLQSVTFALFDLLLWMNQLSESET